MRKVGGGGEEKVALLIPHQIRIYRHIKCIYIYYHYLLSHKSCVYDTVVNCDKIKRFIIGLFAPKCMV